MLAPIDHPRYWREGSQLKPSKAIRFERWNREVASAQSFIDCAETGGSRPFAPKVSFPPGDAIRGQSRSSTALDLEPTAQTDPSRSLSFAFGTALPAPKPSFAGRTQPNKLLPWH